MVRGLTQFEIDAAKESRDYARDFIGELFPKARVVINLAMADGQINLNARIMGDTAPHEPHEIIECLGELGVQEVQVVELQPQ